ncbi:MAG: signal peptidase I [Proteobacteria bacterium]|nr:signal peptidase I [Pseudomonadota bacterium]
MNLIYDFSFALVVAAAVTGAVWALDLWLLRRHRPAGAAEPWPVEYARSFFPIILIVLVVRSFLFEPFRIPSDSMMPTLLDGDFIFVSKFSYGLRLPVLNTKILATGEPERGDVIVFRKPSEPSVNYIKRLVGLPGDKIEVRGDAIWVNGREMHARDDGLFTEDACYRNFRQGTEQLGEHQHRIMYCPLDVRRDVCTADRALNICTGGREGAQPSLAQKSNGLGALDTFERGWVVPPGMYFFMGDNRDNSADSRFDLGYVPEANLVGKAVRIWASHDGFVVRWKRLGMAVH